MDEGADESPVTESGFVLFVARVVGFLVAIVAIVLGILLLMTFRAFLYFGLSNMGAIGLSALIAVSMWFAINIGKIDPKTIWIIFYRGCL